MSASESFSEVILPLSIRVILNFRVSSVSQYMRCDYTLGSTLFDFSFSARAYVRINYEKTERNLSQKQDVICIGKSESTSWKKRILPKGFVFYCLLVIVAEWMIDIWGLDALDPLTISLWSIIP